MGSPKAASSGCTRKWGVSGMGVRWLAYDPRHPRPRPNTRSGPDGHVVQAVGHAVLLGNLLTPMLAGRVEALGLGRHVLVHLFQWVGVAPVDGGGTGVDHPLHAVDAAGLEYVGRAHALHPEIGHHLLFYGAAQYGGQVDHPVDVVAVHSKQKFVGFQDVSLDDGDLVPYFRNVGHPWVHVEQDQSLLALFPHHVVGQVGAQESRSAGNHYSHRSTYSTP